MLTAMFVGTAMPVQAASSVNTSGYFVWVNSKGQTGITPMNEIKTDGFETCSGTSPLVNGCVLHDYSVYGYWTFGWFYPPDATGTGLVGGPFVGSTKATLHGSNGAADWIFECNWAGMSVFGFFGPPGVGVLCNLLQASYPYPAGALTATFHNGVYDVHALPYVGPSLPGGANDVEGAVGPWEALLFAF